MKHDLNTEVEFAPNIDLSKPKGKYDEYITLAVPHEAVEVVDSQGDHTEITIGMNVVDVGGDIIDVMQESLKDTGLSRSQIAAVIDDCCVVIREALLLNALRSMVIKK